MMRLYPHSIPLRSYGPVPRVEQEMLCADDDGCSGGTRAYRQDFAGELDEGALRFLKTGK